jgi:hypothetical protein
MGLEVRKGGAGMNSLLRHIMGFGSIGESNPQSMHYKHVPFEDRVCHPVYWKCPSCSEQHLISRLMDTSQWRDCHICRDKKPKYKWSWKLNKAVRL